MGLLFFCFPWLVLILTLFPEICSLKSWFLSRIVGTKEIACCSFRQCHEMDFNRHTWILQQNHETYVCRHRVVLHCAAFWFQPAECCHRKEGFHFIYDLESEWVESIGMQILVDYRDKWLCQYDLLLTLIPGVIMSYLWLEVLDWPACLPLLGE